MMDAQRPHRAARGAARRIVVTLAAVAAAAALAACSSPPSHFYTLSSNTPATASTMAANPPLLIEVPPVDVPPQVAKNQLVVQSAPNQVDVLEQDRWASLPGDEIRRALSTDLTQRLNTIDVYGNAYPDSKPVYRVSLNVQRFESWPGSHALIDAVWSVRSVKTTAITTCRSVVEQPTGGAGYGAVVSAHRAALQQIVDQIAAVVQTMAAQPAAARAATSADGKAAPATSMSVACPAAASTGLPASAIGGPARNLRD